MPTLCFQLTYPRTESIDWYWLLKYSVKSTLSLIFFYYMVSHQFFPTLTDSIEMFKSGNPIKILNAVHKKKYAKSQILKMSLPNTIVWLMSFFTFFHYTLNILAELTYFGDRQFYRVNSKFID